MNTFDAMDSRDELALTYLVAIQKGWNSSRIRTFFDAAEMLAKRTGRDLVEVIDNARADAGQVATFDAVQVDGSFVVVEA